MSGMSLIGRPANAWDLWLAVLLLVCYAGFAVWTFRRTFSRQRAWLFLLLRAVAAGLLLSVFFQAGVQRLMRAGKVSVAVILDRSGSMAVSDAGPDGKSTRWTESLFHINAATRTWEDRFVPGYFTLDQKFQSVSPVLISSAAPKGAGSDLSRLENISKDLSGVRAMVLFSDGRHGGPGDPVTAAARLGVPLYAVGVGEDKPVPDLILESVRAPHFAFKNTEVEVSVRVVRKGFALEKCPVELLEGGNTVSATEVLLSSSSGTGEAVLRLRPSSTGRKTYSARVPGYQSESNRNNNARRFSLDVIRDRVRVLYICGRPGPHYGFLRHQLKSNPSVELVSFVILRDPEDVMTFSDQELSLIPFPTQDVLLGQLKSFDLVLLEQFAFSHFGMGAAAVSALREYVEKGGGLLLAGNEEVFGPQSPYRQPPLEEILPLLLDTVVPGPKSFSLEIGEPAHPVMSFNDDVSSSRAVWSRLPPLEGSGFFPGRLRPGALSLAGVRTQGGAVPIISVRTQGRGRVMMLTSLNSWRWALVESGRGRGPWAYQTFWNNVLRWMTASDDFRLVRLELPEEIVPPEEEVTVRAFVRDESYRPLQSGHVSLSVAGASGVVFQGTMKALGNGEFAETVVLPEAGSYRASVRALRGSRKLGDDEGVLRAGSSWDEFQDTSTDFSLLREMAEAGGGDFIPGGEFSPSWLEERLKKSSFSTQRALSLWNSPWVLILIVGTLFAEWFLRRRWGEGR